MNTNIILTIKSALWYAVPYRICYTYVCCFSEFSSFMIHVGVSSSDSSSNSSYGWSSRNSSSVGLIIILVTHLKMFLSFILGGTEARWATSLLALLHLRSFLWRPTCRKCKTLSMSRGKLHHHLNNYYYCWLFLMQYQIPE